VTPNKQPADSQISAVLAEELADVEASAETRDIGQQLLSSCFRFLRRLLVVGLGVYLLMLACLAFFENRILYQGAKYSADIWKPLKMHPVQYGLAPFCIAMATGKTLRRRP